jgi:hypothetical protein
MFRAVVIIVLAIALSGCDAFSALKDGMQHAQAVEGDLEQSTGVRPQVGFNWRNGRLASVTVMFPSLYQAKPLGDLAGGARDGDQGIQADAGRDRALLCFGQGSLGLRAARAAVATCRPFGATGGGAGRDNGSGPGSSRTL